MDTTLLNLGEEAISKLAVRSTEVQGFVEKNFSPKTLEQVQAEFVTALSPAAAENVVVAKLCSLVRDQAAQTIEDLKNCEMWLHCKTPAVSDGNNFGVDVQVYVLGELVKMRTECTAMLDAVQSYHMSRATGMEKIVSLSTSDKDQEKVTEKSTGGKDGDKSTVTEKTIEKTHAKSLSPLPDQLKYLAALDTKEYHACYLRLTDLRNTYVKAHLMISKNQKRLADPRGDGEGTRANSMSMF